MSFSQFLKDYILSINDFYDAFSGDIHFDFLLNFLLFHISQSAKFLIQYVLTFRWLNDFYSLKVLIPQFLNSNLNSLYSSANSSSIFFNFFENPNSTPNFFIIGLINSLVLSVPFSPSQFLWIRRLTVEGPLSGSVSGLGIILSQFLLNICVLLGLRFVIFPWYSFGLINYILGIILTLNVIYKTANRPLKRIKLSDTTQLVKIFFLHFILTWTEQSTIFQYISNISFNPEPTIFENLTPYRGLHSILSHWNYFSGLLLGTAFWTSFFGGIILAIGHSASKFFNFSYSIWVRRLHYLSIVFTIAFTITSFPYYNLDYLVASPLGFISEDNALKELQLKVNSFDLKKGRLGEYSSHKTLDTDVVPFDRGRYQTGSETELTFEDLNYQGEYVWRTRNDRLSSGSAGLVNNLLSKFLPKLKAAQKRTYAIAKSRNIQKRREREKIKEKINETIDEMDIEDDDFLEDIDEAEDDLLDEDEDDEDDEEEEPGLESEFFEEFVKRFLRDYQSDVTESDLPYNESDQEPYSAFLELARYGFDSFATNEQIESDGFEEKLGRRIKSKYYLNTVYRFILNFELSNFLKRQPRSYSLTKEEEDTLFQKRSILASYYDSLRVYSRLPYSEVFEELFLGPKSYANRIYNNQFKGTLKIIRRLFSISFEGAYSRNKESILKFDQPLYKERLDDQDTLIHEELLSHSYLNSERIRTPFLKEVDSIPFYAGWDKTLRKFLVTNYWLNYSNAGVKYRFSNIFNSPNLKKRFSGKRSKVIHFVTWPLSKKKMEKLKIKQQKSATLMFSVFDDPVNRPQRDIFEYVESDDDEMRLVYETLPSILRRVDIRDKEKEQISVQPLRGGVIWPGSESPKLKFKEVLDILVTLGRD